MGQIHMITVSESLLKFSHNAKALFRARLKGRISVHRKNESKMNAEQITKNALTEIKPVLCEDTFFLLELFAGSRSIGKVAE